MSEYIKQQIKDYYNPDNDFRRDVPVSFSEYALLGMIEDLEKDTLELSAANEQLKNKVELLEEETAESALFVKKLNNANWKLETRVNKLEEKVNALMALQGC